MKTRGVGGDITCAAVVDDDEILCGSPNAVDRPEPDFAELTQETKTAKP